MRPFRRGFLGIAERGGGACPEPRTPPLDRDDLQGQRERSAVELLGELRHRRHTPHEPLVVERPLDEGGRMAAPDAGSRIVFGELPKTATGKIQKFALRERASGRDE